MVFLSVLAVILATGSGSVFIHPGDCATILFHKITGTPGAAGISAIQTGIVWNLRFPRVLLAFISGAALSASGAVMQSVLKNPLASSFTLGVSSGASLGAGLVLMAGLTLPFAGGESGLAGSFTVPVAGFAFSLLTVAAVMRFSRAIDPRLENNTIILVGMVLSLFVNAMLTLVSALSREDMNRLLFWQMGSFALKGWKPVAILAPLVALCAFAILRLSRELDIMTFGDDEAVALGVPVKRDKRILIALSSVLTGCTVAFVGVVGFLDLAVPHIARRVLGPAHRALIPFTMLAGGIFMVAADLVARTAIPPLDLPVGAITALLGAPFFGWVFLREGRKRP